jgi:ABC-type transport system involved in multi-copper enzyme maturation permease subunit
MKFLAILKDSFREAVDTRVIYVLIGLSCLLILLTATLSFKPSPMGREVMTLLALGVDRDITAVDIQQASMGQEVKGMFTYSVADVRPVDGEPDGPGSSYLVTLRAHFRSPAEATAVKLAPRETEQRIRDRFGRFDEWRVEEVTAVRPVGPGAPGVATSPNPDDIYFEVTTRPTAATTRIWPHEPSLFFGALPIPGLGVVPLGLQLYVIENRIVGGFGAWIALLIAVIVTAFFIPNMLRKGSIDLLLVKPISRWLLLTYKYIGGLTFVFVTTAVAIGGVWLALGWRSHIWASGFLLIIPVLTFVFAILYAVSTLFAVLTRSAIVAILMTLVTWLVLYAVGLGYQLLEAARLTEAKNDTPVEERWSGSATDHVVRALHFGLPRHKDLDYLTSSLLLRDLMTANQIKQNQLEDTKINWAESLTVSGVFIAVMLSLSCLRFATRDY